jgi:curli production assembly/transport component CsgE
LLFTVHCVYNNIIYLIHYLYNILNTFASRKRGIVFLNTYVVANRSFPSVLLNRHGSARSWLLLACAWGSATMGWAQAKPKRLLAPAHLAQPATRPVPVPKANLGPRVLITPSKNPLPPAQLEEALRLLLRADSTNRLPAHTGTEAEGLVLDQALTKLGHDFYDLFYSAFEAPPGSTNFTVLIGERPGRGNSSLVVLTVDEQELLETPLPTRLDQMEELVAETVAIAQDYLAEAQRMSSLLEKGRRAPLEVY